MRLSEIINVSLEENKKQIGFSQKGNLISTYLGISIDYQCLKIVKKDHNVDVYIDKYEPPYSFQEDVESNIFDKIDKSGDHIYGSEQTIYNEFISLIWNEVNDNRNDYVIIPCYAHKDYLYLICITDLNKFVSLLGDKDWATWSRTFTNKYPVLYFILKHSLFDYYFESKDMGWRSVIGCGTMIETVKIVNNIFQYLDIPGVELFQELSNMLYEGSKNIGVIDFVQNSKIETNDYKIVFKDQCVLYKSQGRILRKYLQMSNNYMHLIAYHYEPFDSAYRSWFIKGMGVCDNRICQIRFLGNSKWSCEFENEMVIFNGTEYELFNKNRKIQKDIDTGKIQSVFENDINKMNQLIQKLIEQKHGTMLIISEKAKEEAERLGELHRAIRIQTIDLNSLSKEEIVAISSVDGCILVDDKCNCFAVGVILDGEARIYADLGRGARYNSALSYLYNMKMDNIKAVAVVISEDGMVDVKTMSEIEYQDDDLYRGILRDVSDAMAAEVDEWDDVIDLAYI